MRDGSSRGSPGGPGQGEPLDPDGPGPDEDELDDDAPLEPDEAAAGSALAGAETDESLAGRVEAVTEELEGVARRRDGEGITWLAGGRPFAVLSGERLEVMLDPAVARAALATPDTVASARGAGWISFTPAVTDRFALDRAEAWVRSAHRRAARG